MSERGVGDGDLPAHGTLSSGGRREGRVDPRLRIALSEGESWRERAQGYVAGLGQEIEKQFEQWQLTGAEREVGLLMLKGFSHRELAGLRGTTEATVRHQARAIYQKSSLPGRAAFCAYFLEDLLPARDDESTRGS